MLRQKSAALALAAITFVAGGCGGSSKSSSEDSSTGHAVRTIETKATVGSTPLTRTQLTVAADAICGRIRARLAQNSFKTPQEVGSAAPAIAAYERTALAEMEKLMPPASLTGDWKQIVGGIRTLASDAAKIGEYARTDQLESPAGHAFLVATGKHGALAASIARRDGIDRCAEAV